MAEQDEGARVGLWRVIGIITPLLFGLIGSLVIRTPQTPHTQLAKHAGKHAAKDAAKHAAKHTAKPVAVAATPAAAAAASAAAETDTMVDAPLAGEVVTLVFFGVDQAESQADAGAALTAQGADAARVQLRRPEQTALGGPAEEARRVEVRRVDRAGGGRPVGLTSGRADFRTA